MTKQKELIKQVISKNKMSNVLLCAKIIFDLCAQIICIRLIVLYFNSTLSKEQIYIQCGAILICFLLKAVCTYGATWTAHKAAYECLNDMRIKIIRHLKKLPMGFFHERKTGDLTNIIRHDVEQIEIYLAHGLPEIMSATILPCAAFFVMLWIDLRLALVMIAGLPLMWLTKKVSAPVWQKNIKIFSDSIKRMQENIMEYIANISVIKAFAKEETKTQSTLKSAKDYDFWVKKAMNGVSFPMGLITLFMESGLLFVMVLGTYLFYKEQITIFQFILSIILGGLFTSSITKVATFQHYSIVFNQAMEAVGSILSVPPSSRPSISPSALNGNIEISNLDFSYDDNKKVLHDINLCFAKGSKNAIIGTSGCGKTTIANILMGFWKPTKGSIRICGQDTALLSEKELNSLFSIVQQDVFLFNLSMEENIRIGKPEATMDEIINAAKKARIHDFIMSLEDGYRTKIGENGIGLSGGQKQRISIARAFLKDAPIVLLDEITSNVDPVNEVLIQQAVCELAKNRTVIVIAHRLSTVKNADQILVFKNGKIVQAGKHDALIANENGYYNKLHNVARN